jgi:hypothetical protein
MIGRDEEIDLLLRRWARAKSGDGQVVLVSGEPGIGKSRITGEFAERLQSEPHIRLRYYCSPYHQDSALHPFVDQLVWASGFTRDDPPAFRLDKLGVLLARATPTDAMWHSSRICCHCPYPNATRFRKSARSGRKSGRWTLWSVSSKVWLSCSQ